MSKGQTLIAEGYAGKHLKHAIGVFSWLEKRLHKLKSPELCEMNMKYDNVYVKCKCK
jgi:hypothetical protein